MKEAFGLYLVLTDPATGYEKCTEAAVEAGVRYVQLRMKSNSWEEVLDMARRLRRITAGSATRFVVNDDVEIAREADADGVHLGQLDMSLAEARKRWPVPGKIFGWSTHNEQQQRRAEELAPDYIGVGPVFATPTKQDADPTLGLDRTGRMILGTTLTAVAIGGINRENLTEVLRHGAVNYAVVRAVTQASDPRAAIQALQDIWKEHRAFIRGSEK